MCAKRISSNEAATRLNCPQRTVQGWAKAGRIPGAVQLPGGQWRIPAAWVKETSMVSSEQLVPLLDAKDVAENLDITMTTHVANHSARLYL